MNGRNSGVSNLSSKRVTDQPSSQTLTRSIALSNRRGLHARASANFVRLATSFEADVEVTKDGTTVCGTSIMGLMMLRAAAGESITIAASGPDAKAALEALVALVEARFNEEI